MNNDGAKQALVESKEYQVDTQIALLDQALDRLSNVVIQLEERIVSILLDTPPEVAGEGKDVESLVPLAEGIRRKCKATHRIADQVYSMVDRIEL